ncbi:MAG TPA: DoxX family protein [Chloroflexota bacterium]|jgi:uncharacterized membrane protein YphA (DoxX/SURF4 family)
MNIVLWIVQIILALTFAGAGATKLVTPIAELSAQMPLPLPAQEITFRLIGMLEVLGAVGLIVPWLLRIRPRLTPIAGACLALEMVVATVYTVIGMGLGPAVMPLVLGVLSAGVAIGRWPSAGARDRSEARREQGRATAHQHSAQPTR